MEHVVFFPAPDGSPAFRRFADLPEAVRFVEHLRNVENVADASVHALTEVPLSFKAWYRVELPVAAEIPAGLSDVRTEVAEPASEPAVSGSATGLLVPDQSLVPEQFAGAPVVAEPASEAEESAAVSAAEPIAVQDVLAPGTGRRERGIGFFAR